MRQPSKLVTIEDALFDGFQPSSHYGGNVEVTIALEEITPAEYPCMLIAAGRNGFTEVMEALALGVNRD